MSREITAHRGNGLNEAIIITAVDASDAAGDACHIYELHFTQGSGKSVRLEFQNGPIKEAGYNGISNEALLAVVIDRLESFQSGPFACEDNAAALKSVQRGLNRLLKRTQTRIQQGVEGTNQAHDEKSAPKLVGVPDTVD